MAGTGIESANVVGYTGGTTGADNNFITIPFTSVGDNTSDIQQIKLSDGGAGTLGYGTEYLSVWAGVPSVVEGSEYYYWDPMYDPTSTATGYYWGDSAGNKTAFSIALGQGVVINCAEDLSVTTAGQVPTGQVSFTSVADNNFSGNPFPQGIDIQAVKIDDDSAGTIGYGTEYFSIWEGVPTIAAGSEFYYWDPMYDTSATATGYYWGDSAGNAASYTIPAGQGNDSNCAEALTISIDPPYTLGE